MAPSAYVLGGGLAGICAAFRLKDLGYQVELLESRRWLGGRAFTLPERGDLEVEGDRAVGPAGDTVPAGDTAPRATEPRDGGPTDNGPHVMMGAYTDVRALLKRIGTVDQFLVPPSLDVAYRSAEGRVSRLKLMPLPVPLAFPWALPGLKLGVAGSLRTVWGLICVLRRPAASQSLEEWIRRNHQRGVPDRYLWTPMCRAILNAEPDQVEARLFLATLRQAFLGSAGRAAIWVPRRGWGELVGQASQQQMKREGIQVTTGARVVALGGEAAVTSIQLADGSHRNVAAGEPVVSALPWFAYRKLSGAPEAGVDLEAAPIVNLYVELEADGDAPPDEGPLTTLVDGDPFHYLYRSPGDPPRRFALIAGAAQPLAGVSVGEIEQIARRQLARHYPGFRIEAPGRARVVKENLATLLPSPGGVPRPPAGRYQRNNLWLCGDWVDTGLPSTLEGAARSARLALVELPAVAH